MYIATTAHLNPKTFIVHFSSTAGIIHDQVAHLGSEEKSTLLRGYLLAAVDGFKKLENLYGREKGDLVELMIPDEKIAQQFRDLGPMSLSKTLHFDNADLWAKIRERKSDYLVRVISHVDESEALSRVWFLQRPASEWNNPLVR
jgi:hypothetical protein